MPRISALVVGLGLLFVSPALSQQTARSNPTQERARVHYRQGWEHMRAEAFDVAAAEFGQAIELYPQYAMAHYSLGRAYMALRRYQDAVRALTTVLRKELVGRVRVTTVDPGMVGDTEFSDVRFEGDAEKKDAVYRGVRYLTPDDVADTIIWALTRPEYMVVDEVVIKPLQQASQDQIVREG